MNREVSDIDAEFRALIGARVMAYQGQAAFYSARAETALNYHLVSGMLWYAINAKVWQGLSAERSAKARYWLNILITGAY